MEDIVDKYNIVYPAIGCSPAIIYKKFYIVICLSAIDKNIEDIIEFHDKIIDYIIDNHEHTFIRVKNIDYCRIGMYELFFYDKFVSFTSRIHCTVINLDSFEEFVEFLNKNCHEQYMHKDIKIALKN